MRKEELEKLKKLLQEASTLLRKSNSGISLTTARTLIERENFNQQLFKAEIERNLDMLNLEDRTPQILALSDKLKEILVPIEEVLDEKYEHEDEKRETNDLENYEHKETREENHEFQHRGKRPESHEDASRQKIEPSVGIAFSTEASKPSQIVPRPPKKSGFGREDGVYKVAGTKEEYTKNGGEYSYTQKDKADRVKAVHQMVDHFVENGGKEAQLFGNDIELLHLTYYRLQANGIKNIKMPDGVEPPMIHSMPMLK